MQLFGRRLNPPTGKFPLCNSVCFDLEFIPVRFSGVFPLKHIGFCYFCSVVVNAGSSGCLGSISMVLRIVAGLTSCSSTHWACVLNFPPPVST